MPCWYYEKKDLMNTPSFRESISHENEARYRRDGARFIIDAGSKMGLRYDTCATGVVYFQRFYMFHSFSEFPRCVTAACCLFLAGKVEETPKKCKDLIKITKSMLTDAQFASFKEDPKEEILTLERILLQTIKFDLMVEHPYAYLLKFAKLIKGDKNKVQKLVQMSWTFINDSLCTTLSLQWEPEVIAVALMYLTSRLNKFDINDWQGKPSGYRGKWYEFFVEDVTLDLLEDICHQVLDLYSKPVSKSAAESPVVTENVKEDSSSNSNAAYKSPISPAQVQVQNKVQADSVSRNSQSFSNNNFNHPQSNFSELSAVSAPANPTSYITTYNSTLQSGSNKNHNLENDKLDTQYLFEANAVSYASSSIAYSNQSMEQHQSIESSHIAGPSSFHKKQKTDIEPITSSYNNPNNFYKSLIKSSTGAYMDPIIESDQTSTVPYYTGCQISEDPYKTSAAYSTNLSEDLYKTTAAYSSNIIEDSYKASGSNTYSTNLPDDPYKSSNSYSSNLANFHHQTTSSIPSYGLNHDKYLEPPPNERIHQDSYLEPPQPSGRMHQNNYSESVLPKRKPYQYYPQQNSSNRGYNKPQSSNYTGGQYNKSKPYVPSYSGTYANNKDYHNNNSYLNNSGMYSSSFMSQEGTESITNLMDRKSNNSNMRYPPYDNRHNPEFH